MQTGQMQIGQMKDQHQELLTDFQRFARLASTTRERLMQHISDRLHAELVRYNWVGFYLIDKADPRTLVLGPFSGTDTPHVRIPFDKGLCGAAATSGETVMVNDVSTDTRYLAESGLTQSEIVVPIFLGKRLVAELDINSYFKNTWDSIEHRFVESCAALVAEKLVG